MNLSRFKNKKILITGHTGFKGSWLCLWLSSLGAEVYGVSRDVPTQPSHFDSAHIKELMLDHRLDISNASALIDLVKKIQPDYVFHLAAQALVGRSYENPMETWQTNLMGTINLLESLRALDKPCVAVFITSDKCYENLEWVWGYRETDSLGGADPYSSSKASADIAISSYARSFFPPDGLVRIGIARAGNVIGGGDWAEARIVPDCMRAWALGDVVSIRNPKATRPWQHVLEPLSGYLTLAMELLDNSALHGEPFNFGPPAQQNHTVIDLAIEMAKYWDHVRWVDASTSQQGFKESGLLKLNCDKALKELKWVATWDFESTAYQTTSWYRHFYEDPSENIANFSMSQIIDYTNHAKEKGLKWAQ
jgi:CDP-glucose 4,6-dehydratase